jgi:hypothetical protein
LAAANGWTRLGWGVCAVILLFNTMIPRRRRTVQEPVIADERRVGQTRTPAAAPAEPATRTQAAEPATRTQAAEPATRTEAAETRPLVTRDPGAGPAANEAAPTANEAPVAPRESRLGPADDGATMPASEAETTRHGLADE